MSSGPRTLVVNPLERAVSTDIMRLQYFADAATSGFLQALLNNPPGTDDVQAGAQYNPNTLAGTPSAGDVFSGLLFQPVGGSTAAGVTAGVVGIFDPDNSPSSDDSQYKMVTDPGTVTNSLSLTPNSSGSLRLDVIECSRVQPDNIIETDSRDIFNTITGLFAAATVNKVAQAQLQYRIRTGVPGSGFPGSVQGWLPLAVASVPTATTTWDTVTIWDVRPLLEDRVFSLTPATRDLPQQTRCLAQIDALTTANQSRLTGVVEVELLSRKYGGAMFSSCPQGTGGGVGSGADAKYVDLDDAQNQSATGSIGTSGLNYVYLCAPFSLPRWAKYTAGPAGRVPRSPRGIVVASSTPPDLAYGTPHSALSLPPCFQDSGNTQSVSVLSRAVCVLARVGNSATSPLTGGLVATGRLHVSNNAVSTKTSTPAFGAVGFTFVPGTDFPAHARAIYVQIIGQFTLTGTVSSFQVQAGSVFVQVALPSSGSISQINLGSQLVVSGPLLTGATYTASSVFGSLVVRVPVLPYYQLVGVPGTSTPGDVQPTAIAWQPTFVATGGGSVAFASGASQQATIQQWELGD
jgi:hypothetical protein